jgi:hypothetical protein
LAGKTCLPTPQTAKQGRAAFTLLAEPSWMFARPSFASDAAESDRGSWRLRKYRDQDITLRGVVRSTHGRMGMVISHIRQFRGGPEKFRPNPKLLKDFNAQSIGHPFAIPTSPVGRPASQLHEFERPGAAAVRKEARIPRVKSLFECFRLPGTRFLSKPTGAKAPKIATPGRA